MVISRTSQRRRYATLALVGLLGVGSLVMISPFVYALFSSLMTDAEYATMLFPFPKRLYLGNFLGLMSESSLWMMFLRSLIRCMWYIVIHTAVALLAGYVFARLNFRGKNATFLTLLISMIIPPQVGVVPYYVMLARWPLVGGNDLFGQGGSGMINTWAALLIGGLVPAFGIFLVKQSIESVPIAYDEAARIDGANTLQIIFKIHLHMVKPVLFTLAILDFIGVWNDYFTPLIFANSENLAVVPLGIQQLLAKMMFQLPNLPLVFAASILGMLPTVVVFLLFQRYLVQGFAGAGVKG